MEIKEIELFYTNKLVKNLFVNFSFLNENISILNEIGVPNIILDKFMPCTQHAIDDIIIFSKSKMSEIYLGIEIRSNNVICFSYKYKTYSYMNVDYERFIRTNYTYETFKLLCISEQIYGPYYDNTPIGGNFEKYAIVLEELILDIDERATKEGVWHSLIEEMKLGVI